MGRGDVFAMPVSVPLPHVWSVRLSCPLLRALSVRVTTGISPS